MPTIIEQIKECISRSDIPLPDKEDMLQLFARANVEAMGSILHLFNQNPSWISTINDNIKAKWNALSLGNAASWEKIIKEEVEQLKTLE